MVSQKDESEAKRFVDDLIASLEEIEEGTIVRGSGETGRRNQESDEEGPTEGGFWEEIEAELDIAKRNGKNLSFHPRARPEQISLDSRNISLTVVICRKMTSQLRVVRD